MLNVKILRIYVNNNIKSTKMSDCCSDQDDSRHKRKRIGKNKYNKIEWKSTAASGSAIATTFSSLSAIPPPPPLPKTLIGGRNANFIKQQPDREIQLSNGSILIQRMKFSDIMYDHYEYHVGKLDDLLALNDYYQEHGDSEKSSNINFEGISKLAPHIYELERMVGMEDVKKQVLSLVLFFLQSLDSCNQDMLHSVIYGNPGVGKTRLIYILANIFASLGVTPSNKVTFVKRADLIGQYLGHTAIKTKKVLEDACGGVLVIDEAYSLGDTEQRDSFSRECIDTLNQYLSECKRDLICVIAGYKEDLETRFFKTNSGLKRRFAFQYEIADYNAGQLREIFLQHVKNNGWELTDDAASSEFFEENRDFFVHNGGDMELLFAKIKYEHASRIFSGFHTDRKIITREDVQAGMEKFLENNGKEGKKDQVPFMMYT